MVAGEPAAAKCQPHSPSPEPITTKSPKIQGPIPIIYDSKPHPHARPSEQHALKYLGVINNHSLDGERPNNVRHHCRSIIVAEESVRTNWQLCRFAPTGIFATPLFVVRRLGMSCVVNHMMNHMVDVVAMVRRLMMAQSKVSANPILGECGLCPNQQKHSSDKYRADEHE